MTPASIIRSLLEASARGELAGNEERWFSRGIIQVEWPNRLDPNGSTRDFEELQAFNRRLEQDCVRRHFELASLLAADEQVAAEMTFQLTF
jgi:hypothetical protein